MRVLLSCFGAMLGVILALLLIAGFIYFKIRNAVGSANMSQLIHMAKNAKSLEQEEYSRVKSISGMTGLLSSEIQRDIPDFNKDVLFSKAQHNLGKIFNAITNKSIAEIEEDDDFFLVLPMVKSIVESSTKIEYNNIEFHDAAIKKYDRGTGMATITISTNVGYNYSDSANPRNDEFKNLKKETRYTCKFVYIYDERRFTKNQKGFSVSCPNCGAPITSLSSNICEYCSSKIVPINLKMWKMSSYEEDFRNNRR